MENTEITDKDSNNTVSPVQTENSAAPADNESEAAEAAAQATLDDVKKAMKIDYFNDLDLIREQAARFNM